MWNEITKSNTSANEAKIDSYLAVIKTAEPAQNPTKERTKATVQYDKEKLFYYEDSLHKISLGFRWITVYNEYWINVGYDGKDTLEGLKIGWTKCREFMDTNGLNTMKGICPKDTGNKIMNEFLSNVPKIIWEWNYESESVGHIVWSFYRDPKRLKEDKLWTHI